MLVRATEACFIDGQRRRAGAEFEYAGKELPAHLVPVKAKTEAKAAPKQEPITLSEMATTEAKPKSFVESVTKKPSK